MNFNLQKIKPTLKNHSQKKQRTKLLYKSVREANKAKNFKFWGTKNGVIHAKKNENRR